MAFERLKSGLAFALLSASGDAEPGDGAGGVYCRDTRVVDRYRVEVGASSRFEIVSSENLDDRLVVRLRLATAAGVWRFVRTVRLTESALTDSWRWQAPTGAQALDLHVDVATAFRDIFEVRGHRRARRGSLWPDADGLGVRYLSLDRRAYRLRLSGRRLRPDHGAPLVSLPGAGGTRRGAFTLRLGWRTATGGGKPRRTTTALRLPRLVSADPLWDCVWQRAARDLAMLAADLGHGPVLLAGLPWFASLFGRDAILSALLLLPLAPDLGKSTVETLAALQGTRNDPWREEAPGKILHERRLGEMARTGEVPFGRYYGAVDGTALFVTLVARTWQRTGDDAWLGRQEGALRAALAWIEQSGREDPTLGLVRFAPSAPGGLVVQSWKDSADSMVHADGALAQPPLAVAEVQGYVYQALRAGALVLAALGDAVSGQALRRRARALRRRFHDAFWLGPERGYAMAIDGHDRPLAVASSDPGQCLWSGIVPAAYRQATVARLMADDLFSGWGLRTLGAREAAYDPLGYHRGSVWPHDSALAAIGMYGAGARRDADRLATALVDAAGAMPASRLPELFAGTERVAGRPPDLFGPACVPQAWAAAVPLALFAAMLSLRIDERRRVVRLAPAVARPVRTCTLGPIAVQGGEIILRVDGEAARLEAAPPAWRLEAAPPVA